MFQHISYNNNNNGDFVSGILNQTTFSLTKKVGLIDYSFIVNLNGPHLFSHTWNERGYVSPLGLSVLVCSPIWHEGREYRG